ncbi:hypothetical protein Ssi03_31040 [Sphaerisporangium siamense]|uniref:Uncharacterized protein n=1 Tax=Sphaerisporangium siamense TaxID=795645 RepID=A0A7W7DCA8_9ACTN|nr:hypothetical protein [Sphaerisporangium siamense]MBB4704205.1 hypothetical protein [Sphaerisporangium siamense]GII85114.1 hypothetical protein Ssi03_31040 [Sphaerisporangium siamense]
MRRAAAVPPVLLAALLLSGCVSPAWDDHDYGLKAAATAEAAASGVELARQAVRGAGRLTTPYLKTLLTQAADDVGGVGDQFGRVQPPSDDSDRLRAEVTGLTSAAEDELRGLLIEVRRDGLHDPAKADRELGDLARRLRAIEETYG